MTVFIIDNGCVDVRMVADNTKAFERWKAHWTHVCVAVGHQRVD